MDNIHIKGSDLPPTMNQNPIMSSEMGVNLVTYEQLHVLGQYANSLNPQVQEFNQALTTATQTKAKCDYPWIVTNSLFMIILFIILVCFLIYFFTAFYFKGIYSKKIGTIFILGFLVLFVVVYISGLNSTVV